MGIKNIIFDLGGVLINIDYKKTANAFGELGVTSFDQMYTQFTADELFESLETGHIAEDRFYELMTKRGQHSLTVMEVQAAWNAMLLDFRMESFQYLEGLKDRFDLYLLSNTNSIHKAAFDELFRKQAGEPPIDAYFKRCYYSHLIGYRKPDPGIYEFVLQDAGIKAGETLFIDDSVNNIEAAGRMGIQTDLLLPGERIENLGYGLI